MTAPKEIARLVALGKEGNLIERREIDLLIFYDESADLIDSDEYRSERGILRIIGYLYDSDGVLDQQFDNRYNELGKYIGGRTKHADGTVNED